MGSNVLTATVTIRGVRPLFFHKFGQESIPLEKGEKRPGVPGNTPGEWRGTTFATKEGQLYVDPSYIFGTIRDGARHTKKGRGSIQSDVVATLQCLDDVVLIDRWLPGFPNGHDCDLEAIPAPNEDRTQPVYLDVRGAVNPSNRARNVRYRIAASAGWSTTFHISFDKTIVPRTLMQAAVIDAGKNCGVGDARKIGMGRFEMVSFDVDEA